MREYQSLIASRALSYDAAQEKAVAVLEQLAARLEDYRPANGWLARWRKAKAAPQGLYLYGAVGRGKSLLMDLFFARARVARKRRVHFHQFMLEVHDRLHRLRVGGGAVDGLLPQVAADLAAEAWLLCFDEFHVGNIADAMILGRLFEALFAAGVVIVATSNAAPDELYKGGLQRERFLPFIELIKRGMAVYNLDGAVDHRYEHWRGLANYFAPLGEASTVAMSDLFRELTGGAATETLKLPVQGRFVTVPQAARGVAWFGFEELCMRPLAAADYLAIATCFHTVMIDGVPLLTPERRNEAARFVILIDALYEAKTQLFMTLATMPEQLCPTGDHAIAFQRTASRLAEMQTAEYRQKGHLG